MTDRKIDFDLINELYDSVHNPSRLPDLLTTFADEIDADATHALIYTDKVGAVLFAAVGRLDPAINDDYKKNYFPYDVRIPRLLAAPPRKVYDDDALISASEKRKSPFHNEFLKRHDCESVILISAPIMNLGHVVIAGGRSRKRGAFKAESRRRLVAYLPHFQRVLEQRLLRDAQATHTRVLTQVLNQCRFGVIVLDRRRIVIHLNRCAEIVLNANRNCIGIDRGKLVSRGREISVNQAIARAVSTSASSPSPSIEVGSIARPNLPPLQYLIALCLPEAPEVRESDIGAVVYLVDSTQPVESRQAALKNLYRFTNTETRCAEILCQGYSVPEIAKYLNCSINTVRAHLRSMYSKTETSRQGEFIALLTRDISVLSQLVSS